MPWTRSESRARLPRRLARVAVGLFVSLAAASLLWRIGSPALADRIADRLLPRLSRDIGRDVTVGRASLALLPPALMLSDIAVAGEGKAPPLLRARSISIHPELWPLIRSGGRELRLARISVLEPELVLVRRVDGTWSLPEPVGGGASVETGGPDIGRVRVERGRLRIVDQPRGGEGDVLLSGIEATIDGVARGRPLTVALEATGDGGAGEVGVHVTLEPFAGGRRSAAGWPALSGRVAARGLRLQPFGALLSPGWTRAMREGELELTAHVRTRRDGAYEVVGSASVLRLRLKGRISGVRFAMRGTVDPARPRDLAFELSRVWLRGPGFEMRGRITIEGLTEARFALSGSTLDLGVLLAPSPGAATEEDRGWASRAIRQGLQRFRLSGTVSVERLRYGRLTLSRVRSRAELVRGVLRLRSGTATFYRGRVEAGGSWMDLTRAVPAWGLTARLDDVDAGLMTRQLFDVEPVMGRMDATLLVRGTLGDWTWVRERLQGRGAVVMGEGRLGPMDVRQEIAKLLRRPLSLATDTLRAGTPIADASASFRVGDGWVWLEGPLRLASPFGPVGARGGVALDGRLRVACVVSVTPRLAGRMLGSLLRPRGPVGVPLRITGTIDEPEVRTRPFAIARDYLLSSPGRRPAEPKEPPRAPGRPQAGPEP